MRDFFTAKIVSWNEMRHHHFKLMLSIRIIKSSYGYRQHLDFQSTPHKLRYTIYVIKVIYVSCLKKCYLLHKCRDHVDVAQRAEYDRRQHSHSDIDIKKVYINIHIYHPLKCLEYKIKPQFIWAFWCPVILFIVFLKHVEWNSLKGYIRGEV